jgi:ribosomal protein L7/L12
MHYKLKKYMVDHLIAFVADAPAEFGPAYLNTKEAITSLAFELIEEGDNLFLPVNSVKNILDIPMGYNSELAPRRATIINQLFNCDIVEYRSQNGFWKIAIPGTEDYALLTSNNYYEAKDLFDTGQEIACIKVLRNATGLGLKATKEMYEQTFANANKVKNNIDVIKGFKGSLYRFNKSDLAEISELLRSGKKIMAIKMFRNKAIGNYQPSLLESKRTCEEFPFVFV